MPHLRRLSTAAALALGLALALVALRPRGARAEDVPPAKPQVAGAATPASVADAVLVATTTKDDAALRALAAKDAPDPWLVADELLARREPDAAAAFARVASSGATEGLAAWVARQAAQPLEPAASRRAVVDAEQRLTDTLAAGHFVPLPVGEAVLASLTAVDGGLGDVSRIRADHARAMAHFILGRRGEAEGILVATAERAASIGWWRRAGRCWFTAGRVPFLKDDYDATHARWDRARSLFERAGDEAGTAEALAGLAAVHAARGDPEGALSRLDAALAVLRRRRTARPMAEAMIHRGIVLLDLSRHAEALAAFDEVRDLARVEGNPLWATVARANMANLYGEVERNDKALELYLETYEDFRASGQLEATALSVGNLGAAYRALGDLDRAREHLEQALRLAKELGNPVLEARTNLSLGEVDLDRGAPASARSRFEAARALAHAAGHLLAETSALWALGRAVEAEGRTEEARGLFDRAVARAEAGPFADLEVVALAGRARCELALKQPEAALHTGFLALERAAGLYRGLSEEEGAGGRGRLSRELAVAVRAAGALGRAEDAYRAIEGARAVALVDALRARDAIHRLVVPAALLAEETAARRREAEARAALRRATEGGERAEIRRRSAEADAARDDLAAVLERLQRDGKATVSGLYARPATSEALRARLAPDEAMVLYHVSPPDAFAVVVTRTGARLVSLGAVEAVEAACRALKVDDPSETLAGVEVLRDLVVRPLALGAEVRRLLVAADGPLGYVPFALLDPAREIAMVPSATTFLALEPGRSAAGGLVLALGDPAYGEVRASPSASLFRARGAARLVRLPATEAEARSVGDELLLGADATETLFRARVAARPHWRAVHLACHGVLDAEHPTLSCLALLDDATNDGFLTALDVFRMRIPADLVVLSACETARGKLVRGEGIVGLTRAFMFAGAPRVLCSLWKVDDDATRALMVKFYELWLGRPRGEAGAVPGASKGARGPGLPTSEALRQAQAFVRSHEKWKHPYYWAAWVLWGLPE